MIPITTQASEAEALIQRLRDRILMQEDQRSFTTFGREMNLTELVAEILSQVNQNGDQAVAKFQAQFDGIQLDSDELCLKDSDIKKAQEQITPEMDADLKLMAERIETYAQSMMPKSIEWQELSHKRLGYRFTPLDRIGAYVPGGLAGSTPLISSVLMNLIPAKVAGVRDIIVASPCGKDGNLHPLLVHACTLAGASKIYKAGGAHGIAAMAYGTDSIPPCPKIVGPGNAFVQEAKRQLFGLIDIDMMAGPSEIAIFADATANPAVLAADMIAQAEHDTLASSVCISEDQEVLKGIQVELEQQLQNLPREAIARESLENYGALIQAPNPQQACAWINDLAPEHLELACTNSNDLLEDIRHAGAIFLGHMTPEVAGDYTAGPSHTLPTCGSARFSSGINVYTFLKSSSLIEYQPEALKEDLPTLTRIARAENLEGHARSAEARFKSKN